MINNNTLESPTFGWHAGSYRLLLWIVNATSYRTRITEATVTIFFFLRRKPFWRRLQLLGTNRLLCRRSWLSCRGIPSGATGQQSLWLLRRAFAIIIDT